MLSNYDLLCSGCGLYSWSHKGQPSPLGRHRLSLPPLQESCTCTHNLSPWFISGDLPPFLAPPLCIRVKTYIAKPGISVNLSQETFQISLPFLV